MCNWNKKTLVGIYKYLTLIKNIKSQNVHHCFNRQSGADTKVRSKVAYHDCCSHVR